MKGSQPLSVGISPEEKLVALCTLSNIGGYIDVARFKRIIAKAPDPETAAEVVLDAFEIPTDTLRRKWHSTVMELWAHQHPHVPPLPGLAVSSTDVLRAP